MKNLMLTTAILAGLSGAAFAQDAAATGMFRPASDAMELRATTFIGMRVYATETEVDAAEYDGMQEGWNDIGEINDVILSRDGSVDAVLVDIGGFLGMGERQVAVSMDAIKFVSDTSTADAAEDFFLVMTAARTDLEAAPDYMLDSGAAATGETMADPAATDTAVVADPAAEPAADADAAVVADPAAAPAADADAAVVADPAATDADTAAVTDPAVTTDPAATGTAREPIARDGYMAAEVEYLTAEKLTGAKVYDANDEVIGEVGTLVLSDAGQVTQAIIDVGGFLGMGEKPVALNLTDIDILRNEAGDDVRVYLAKTKEELEAMPSFEG